MHILILHDQIAQDSRKDETDALVQAQVIAAALQELGHRVSTLGLSLNLQAARDQLLAAQPDLVFNIVEAVGGCGRLIHVACNLLDSLGIPYTGAGADAMFMTSNKLMAKRVLRAAYIPTPAWMSLDDLRRGEPAHRGPYILKSVWEHASVGLDEDSVMNTDSAVELSAALESRLEQLGGEGFAEMYIDGREFNLALLAGDQAASPQVLPPAEIVFEGYPSSKAKVVGWRAKWEEDSFEYHHTPRKYDFPPEDLDLLKRLKNYAAECWKLFGLRGYARVDFRVDKVGRPWVLEINTNPCLSPEAGFAAALERAAIPFPNALERIIADVPQLHADAHDPAVHAQMF
jgi:D-alanine-D-alanine ligase